MAIKHNIKHIKFLKKKWAILPRILKNYFYVRVLRKPRLRTVDFAITWRCNANCPMCSAKELQPQKGDELKPYEIRETLEQAQRLGAIHVNFTGGEPTIRNLYAHHAITHFMNRRDMLVSLVTNSITMTQPELFEWRKQGLDTIQLSLESMDATTHDEIRNCKGNWVKVMQVLVWALELKLNVCLSVVVTKDNFDEVRRIIEFGKRLGVFVLLNPISHHPELSIKDKLPEYYELLEQGHVRADTIINWRGGSGCPAGIERSDDGK